MFALYKNVTLPLLGRWLSQFNDCFGITLFHTHNSICMYWATTEAELLAIIPDSDVIPELPIPHVKKTYFMTYKYKFSSHYKTIETSFNMTFHSNCNYKIFVR